MKSWAGIKPQTTKTENGAVKMCSIELPSLTEMYL